MIKQMSVAFWALISLSFTSCLIGAPQNTIPYALALYDQGFSYLSPLLEKEEIQNVYGEDKNFISKFPFSTYQVVDIPQQGSFFVDKINDTIKNTLRNRQPWEWNNKLIIEAYAKDGSVALDIGSHIGTHTVTMSQSVGPQGMVFAFEPNRKIHRELCLNMSINRCANVNPLRCAIGKEKGLIQVVCSHPQNEGGSYVIKESGGSNTATMIRLDDLQLTNISFIKIDVENMEADVIEGAIETINRCRPVMLIEIQGNGERPMQLGEDTEKMAQESIRKIQSLGYRLERLPGVDYLAFPDY